MDKKLLKTLLGGSLLGSIILFLLKRKEKNNKKREDLTTKILFGFINNDFSPLEKFRYLVDFIEDTDFNINSIDECGKSLLHKIYLFDNRYSKSLLYKIFNRNNDILLFYIQYLNDKGMDMQIRTTDVLRENAFFSLIRNDIFTETAYILLKKYGCDINGLDSEGLNVLYYAENKYKDGDKYLSKKGKNLIRLLKNLGAKSHDYCIEVEEDKESLMTFGESLELTKFVVENGGKELILKGFEIAKNLLISIIKKG